MGTGTPAGMLAEMLAAGMNAHVAGFDQAASLIEKQVLKWLKSLMGFPEAASGLLVSGGTAANLNGLLAVRAAAWSDSRDLVAGRLCLDEMDFAIDVDGDKSVEARPSSGGSAERSDSGRRIQLRGRCQ